MTKIKHFDSCSIFGWMIDPNGMNLFGNELLIYAKLYQMTQSGNFYDGSLDYLAAWAHLESSDMVFGILEALMRRGFVDIDVNCRSDAKEKYRFRAVIHC